ncbi:MAG: mannose-1-phosphate guanylyltransferase [Chloroflexota bacterium]
MTEQRNQAGTSPRSDTHVVILAGGEGTRLWPLSRSKRPKQLLQLNGNRSLIQQTVDRLLPLVSPERVLIVTEATHAHELHAQLPELPSSSIIVEPTRRGTAAALLLAALHVQQRAPDATWASVHSDAFIVDDAEFRRTLSAGLHAASTGEHLVTTGVEPLGPSIDYGYIQRAEKLTEVDGFPVYKVARFVEKPDLPTAQSYLASGEYLWNPGVFIWKNRALIDAFATHLPDVLATLTAVPLAQVDQVYPDARKETIDVGIMEPSQNVATLPAHFGWSAIGSWGELWSLSRQDEHGNASPGQGRVLTADSHRNLVYAEARTVALVGVDDLVVIETNDAIFIAPRSRAQDVRTIVRQLRETGASELL